MPSEVRLVATQTESVRKPWAVSMQALGMKPIMSIGVPLAPTIFGTGKGGGLNLKSSHLAV